MIAELGHFALILAFLVAIVQGVLPILGAHRNQQNWIALARPCAQTQFFLVAFAFACLAQSFLVNDFSVKYVAEHSNTLLPKMYQFAAVWGGHEGSLLLWLLMLAGWGVAVATFSRGLPDVVVARVLGVMGLIAIGLMAFVLLTSNPFERLLPMPTEGRDLNPLLQDPGLVFHPPMLYMGYVGFSVAFAFAIAALLAGRLDATWARWSRPWTTAAWVFLTLGIALGSWWAYYELGWGGWWFWDPVENASFMPWLIGTALIHSLAVTEKRGVFKNWTVLLAIIAFSLSLLGTFLVRSGVLTSVHAFAADPSRGVFILILLAMVVGGSLALFAWRAPKTTAAMNTATTGGAFALFSRETFLLMNNVLLVVAAGTVLLGTLYPLLIDALNMGKLSVGPPYFNAVFVPLMVPLMLLVAVGPLARWKHADLSEMKRRLTLAAVLAMLAGIGLPLLMGTWTLMTGLGSLLAVWIASSVIFQIRERIKISANPGAIPLAYWGMQLGHFGLAVFIIGVTMVGGFQSEMDVKMGPGDTVKVGGYEFRLAGVKNARGPNYQASIGDVEVSKNGVLERIMHPEKRQYLSGSMPMTEAAIDAGITRDIYVSLGEPLDDQGSWSVRVYHKPFVNWIWGGCVLMALGGVLAMLDRRYRVSAKSRVGTAVAAAVVDANGRVSA